MICQDTSLPSKVAENTTRFRTKMNALGFTISVSYIILITITWDSIKTGGLVLIIFHGSLNKDLVYLSFNTSLGR